MSEHGNDPPQLLAADGRRFPVARGRTRVGRSVDCEMCLSDPTVGRQHAVIDAAASVTLSDLSSTNGTWVNGHRLGVGEVVALHDGDVVRLASTELRFSAPAVQHTAVIETQPAADPVTPAAGAPQMHFDTQNAGVINNQILQQVVEQRENFLRAIAASRTRARRLIWVGFLLFVVGGGTYLWMVIQFMSETSAADLDNPPEFDELLGDRIGGIPVGLIGFAVAAVGAVTMVVGIILHIGATSRRRRVVSQPLVPMPAGGAWPTHPYGGRQ